MWVSPFRYLRLIGYLLLPEAFRSLSRLSSALSAKASTLRSFLLGHSDLIALTSDGWCCLVCFYFFAVFLQRLVSSLSYVLRILDVSYMQFSRYDCGIKTLESCRVALRDFNFQLLACSAMTEQNSCSGGCEHQTLALSHHPAVLSAIQTQKLFMLESLVKSPFAYFIFCNPAATCFPMPSPA